MRIKHLLGVLAVAFTLVICGCAAPAATDNSANVTVDPAAVKSGTPEFDGWIMEAVDYVKANAKDEGVLVEFTGMMSQGYAQDTAEMVTLVDPSTVDPFDESVDWTQPQPIEGKSADVYFAEPVEVTKWPHLMGVRGMAFVDPSNPDKIILRGAMETED